MTEPGTPAPIRATTWPDHYLLQVGGTYFGTEIWSASMRFVANTASFLVNRQQQQFAEDALGDWALFMRNANSRTSVAQVLTYAKCNRIDNEGLYADRTTTNEAFNLGPIIQGTQVAVHAPQVALVATYHTDKGRGVGSKGRTYFPSPAIGLGPDGRIPVAERDNFALAVRDLIRNLNNNPGFEPGTGGLDLSIVSPGGKSGGPQTNKVTGVSVGRVLDTQRRRRNQLLERGAPFVPV
jgi:hypothetical protein